MNQTLNLRLAALALAFCSSCFVSRETMNTPLSPDLVSQLVPGETTALQVSELLGAPSEVVQLGFRSAWRYDYARAKRAGFSIIILSFMDNDARSDRVWVFFDEDDLLTNVGSTFEAEGAQWQMPWQDRSHPAVAQTAVQAIEPADAPTAETATPSSAAAASSTAGAAQ